tara:strand:- start:255 stop:497 length:243 start_codon:yes stop_codon:yes gene_type:complete
MVNHTIIHLVEELTIACCLLSKLIRKLNYHKQLLLLQTLAAHLRQIYTHKLPVELEQELVLERAQEPAQEHKRYSLYKQL